LLDYSAHRRGRGEAAQGDEQAVAALHSLADVLATRKDALEADHTRYETWSTETAGSREDGARAHAELVRRGQATEARPEETTLEWWQSFECDCEAFEQHLANLKAQAEAECRPWPPQPITEHQVSPEAEWDNEPDLDTASNAEIPDQPSHEPEPGMSEATTEMEI
jgi:hypothetical protein